MVTKTEVITIRCSKEEKECIVKGAEEEKKTISNFIILSAFERRLRNQLEETLEVKHGDQNNAH